MKDKYTIKIIKTLSNEKHHVTLFLNGKFVAKNYISDDELKKYFKRGKNDIWVSKQDFVEKIEKSNNLINQAVAAMCLKDELHKSYILGSISRTYCKEFNITIAEFTMIIKAAHDNFIRESIEKLGIHCDPNHHNIPKDLQVKNQNNLADIEGKAETSSIGDILKGKGVNIDEYK